MAANNDLHETTANLAASEFGNHDLAPTPAAERTWKTKDFAALWVSMSACIPTYMLASALIKEGMNWWQAVLTIFLANVIVLVPMLLNAHAGTRYGIPFPVYCRAAFGILGANIPALLRALVACGWFGIQAWIGGDAIYQILELYLPDWKTLPKVAFLDLNAAQIACFLGFWALNMFVIFRGIDSIRFLLNIKAPLLIALGLALLAWAYERAGGFGRMLETPSKFAPGGPKEGQFWWFFIAALTANIGFWATLSLNIPDFTRYARSQRDQVLGQAIGLPATMGLYSFIGVAVTSATVVIYGEEIWKPEVLLTRMDSQIVHVIGLFGLCLATLATNIAANVVSPANDFANLAPQSISFRTGGLITGIVGILMQPWKLVADPSGYIYTWLVAYSSLLGAIGGVLIADYYVLRRTRLDVSGLYRRNGPYWYGRGFNPRAMLALACGIAPCVPGFLATVELVEMPGFWKDVYHYAWFVSFGISFAVYLLLARPTAAAAAGLVLLPGAAVPAQESPTPHFRFADVTAKVGLDKYLHANFNHCVAWGDYDGDGRLDVFLGTFSDRNVKKYDVERAPFNKLFRQTAEGTFLYDCQPPVEFPGRCSGAVFADLDNDGDLDLYVSSNRWDKPSPEAWRQVDRAQGCKLFRNDGGRFVDVSGDCGACPDSLFYGRDIGVLDIDGDGYLDLLVLQDTVVKRDGKVFGSRLFRNKGGLKFEDATTVFGLPLGLTGFGIAAADVNLDRQLDFYVCGSNRLYLSQPDKTYKEATSLREVFDHKGQPLDSVTGAAFGDLDGDGDFDLITGPHSYLGPSRIHAFLNAGLTKGVPQFREITTELGLTPMPQKAPNVEIQDFDNDGIPDLYWSAYFAEAEHRWPFLCKGLGAKDGLPRFDVPKVPAFREELLKSNLPPERGRGMIYYVDGPAVDFDGDGRLDLLACNWPPGSSRFFRNETPNPGHWLQVRVIGEKMNRMGIGALVRVYEKGKAGDPKALLGIQQMTINGGYSSSRPAILHFGLGRRSECDVEVRFPHTSQPHIERGVRGDRVHTIREP